MRVKVTAMARAVRIVCWFSMNIRGNLQKLECCALRSSYP